MNQRSQFVSRTRPRGLRLKTINRCRSAAFSTSSRNFDLNGEAKTAKAKQNNPIIATSLGDSNAASHSDQVFGTHNAAGALGVDVAYRCFVARCFPIG